MQYNYFFPYYGCFRPDTCNFFLGFGNIFFDYVDFDVGMKKARQK